MSAVKKPQALILSFFIFLLWWGYLSGRTYHFRGFRVAGTVSQPFDPNNDIYASSKWFPEWTAGNRVMLGWSIAVPYLVLVKPVFWIVRPDLLQTHFPLAFTSTFLLAAALLSAFTALATQFPPVYGGFALLAFGLTPLATLTEGLVQADTLGLFFWSVMIRFLLSASKPNPRRDVMLCAVAGLAGAWTKENEAVALGITLFLLALMQHRHSLQRPFWRMWLAETAGTLTALSISYYLIHRQPDWYWAIPGEKEASAMWRHYAFQIDFSGVWNFLLFMGKSPFIIAVSCFVASLLSGKWCYPAFSRRAQSIVWVLTACLLGHLVTVGVGRYMVAMVYEWSRQLIVFSYLFTWWLFGVIAIVTPVLVQNPKKHDI